jgi:hypothetical protein
MSAARTQLPDCGGGRARCQSDAVSFCTHRPRVNHQHVAGCARAKTHIPTLELIGKSRCERLSGIAHMDQLRQLSAAHVYANGTGHGRIRVRASRERYRCRGKSARAAPARRTTRHRCNDSRDLYSQARRQTTQSARERVPVNDPYPNPSPALSGVELRNSAGTAASKKSK